MNKNMEHTLLDNRNRGWHFVVKRLVSALALDRSSSVLELRLSVMDQYYMLGVANFPYFWCVDNTILAG